MQRLKDKKATSNAKQCEVPSLLIPNLNLVGYPQSDSWVYRYKDPITKKWTAKTIGDAASISLVEAVSRTNILSDAIAAGNSLRDSVINVAEYFDGHYDPQAVLRNKRSIADDRSRFNCHVRTKLGNHPIACLRSYHMKKVVDEMPAHLSSATKNHVTALFKAFCKSAFEDGLIKANPAAGLKKLKVKNARQRVANTAEIRAHCAPSDGETNPLPRQLNRLLFSTAMRLGEALTAKFSDVDLETRFLYLRMTKNGKPRPVPLSEEAIAVIQALAAIRKNEYLFPGRFGGHMARPSAALKRMQAQAGITDFCYHDMRRSACSIAINNDVPLLDASRLLGHSNTSVTQVHYAVLHADRLHTAAAKISDVLRAAMEST